ncbi:hypothetical protein GIB67_000792 [Kingdonia uniflora]|uniref:ATPase AAA-type core domain-containing protein n=1 Tax=Kingdonia uniflora TaxID=39325 RepID=A0A7J7P0L8_9MAGN|nr:hypothetical protein GIB67_000792 [Kingdonia uniflora]
MMEESSVHEIKEEEVVIIERFDPVITTPPEPERRNPRRRLIQSTLFPHKSQQTLDGDEDDAGDDDDVYCGSQKKKRKRKVNKRTPPVKKAPLMIKEASGQSEHTNFLLTGGSDFFIKVSERKLQQKHQKEQGGGALQVEIEKICGDLESVDGKRSPQLLKEKCQRAVSPCKNITPSKSKGTPSKKLTPSKSKGTPSRRNKRNPDSTKDMDDQNDVAHEPVDLRLEAKVAAEENARLSTGKQTHPFFSLWKMSKKIQNTSEASELDSKPCLDLQENKSITCPVHVFEMRQDEFMPLDWRTWTFCEKSSFSCAPEIDLSSVFEGFIKPLTLPDFHTISDPVGASYILNEECLSQSPSQMNDLCPITAAASSTLPNGQTSHLQMEFLQMVKEGCKNGSSLGYTGPIPFIDLEIEPQGMSPQERMKSCYLDCDTQPNTEFGYEPNNSLWTKKYEPQKSFEVCGNCDSVKFLNDWLCSWRERYSRTRINSPSGKQGIGHTHDYSWGENDSDTEILDEGTNLKNVLLVTGPVGSGKSAAIYACAREQGFHIIEVSASDCRNGAHVKQKFGEAMESFGLNNWSAEDFVASQRKDFVKFRPTQPDNPDNDEVEVIGETCKEDLDNINDSGTACGRCPNKTLILFEDVDTIFYEDRGFIASIQQIAETAKRPMILTSNCEDPVLPDQLDRLEVCFRAPSPKDLLLHASTVCAAEEADIHPQLIERLIRSCHGDIRKTIMLLQFWCQGSKQNRKGGKLQSAHGPVQFDLDAGHWVLPKVNSWGCPCPLAELIEKEISKSLCTKRQNDLMEVVEEEDLSSQKTQDSMENNIDARKEAMLRRNCSIQDGSFFAPFENPRDFCNSRSPIAFRRTARRKLNTVLSSESGDELNNDEFPVNSDTLSKDRRTARRKLSTVLSSESGDELNNDKFPVNSDTLSKDPLDSFVGHFENLERENSEENQGKCSKIESDQRVCDTYRSISCVAESFFVPETEVNDGGTSEGVSLSVDMNHLETVAQEVNKISDTRMRSNPAVDAEYVNGDEEVGDSHNEHAETVSRDYQVMDECSRADFSTACYFRERSRSATITCLVQETWRKLRNCRADLKSYLSPEQKDLSKIIELASRMTDLISVSDIMLGCCQPLINDAVELSSVPFIEPDALWWDHEQLEMTSTIAQHGFCIFAKESAARGSSTGDKVDLAREMLMSTTNTTAIGKLVMKNMCTSQNVSTQGTWGPHRNSNSLKREVEENLYSTVQSVVPLKSHLSLKGAAFHEYLSSLGQISRFENSRLSEGTHNTKGRRRRGRTARHYLNSGPLMFSSEDISLLVQHSHYDSSNPIPQ